MSAEDTTVVAQWIENATSEVIKIVFSKKDMTKDEVTEIIKEFTKENFIIEEFGVIENSLVVIIKFNDTVSAKNFVNTIARNINIMTYSSKESSSSVNHFSPWQQVSNFLLSLVSSSPLSSYLALLSLAKIDVVLLKKALKK